MKSIFVPIVSTLGISVIDIPPNVRNTIVYVTKNLLVKLPSSQVMTQILGCCWMFYLFTLWLWLTFQFWVHTYLPINIPYYVIDSSLINIFPVNYFIGIVLLIDIII